MKRINNKDDAFREFLNSKIWAAIDLAPRLDDNKAWTHFRNQVSEESLSVEGFTTKKRPWRTGCQILNASSNGCGLYPASGRTKRVVIYLSIDGYSSSSYYLDRKPDALYDVLKQLPDIEKEFFVLKAEWEKRDKIAELSKNSILAWLKTTMQGSGYAYAVKVFPHRVDLLVKMKNRSQLVIPIYYKSFQNVMPHLLDTIRQYEQLLNAAPVKVLISNIAVNPPKWINDNS
jgi:hypothetical protein